MPTIKFERVERECDANNRARNEGGRLIYDFRVMIDGEFRAMFWRNVLGSGYELEDADRRPIIEPGRTWSPHLGFKVDRKADFEHYTNEMLSLNLIPTLARMAELRAEEAAQAEAERKDKLAKARARAINASGVKLYDALNRLMRCSALSESWSEPARALLTEIDGDITRYQESVAL